MCLSFLGGVDVIKAVLFELQESAPVATPHWHFHMVGRHPVTMPPGHLTGPVERLMEKVEDCRFAYSKGMPKFRPTATVS